MPGAPHKCSEVLKSYCKEETRRDAPLFVQRSCGVCTYTHYLSSMRAVENAVGVTIPKNARIMRNLLHGAQFQQDHVTHFYQLHALDFRRRGGCPESGPQENSGSLGQREQ